MRILIYSESADARSLLADLRGERHHASLRNPQFFNPAQFDRHCERVFADSPEIVKSYQEADIEASFINYLSDRTRQSEVDGKVAADAEDAPSLDSLTVAQLKDLAADKGIELAPGLKKAEIIAAITEAESNGDNSD